ncbi:hypothetical protein DRO97_02755 [Archaeoglobales archaeon]|nr:MAG: hypothetical protein DRO97_02755 [Archaeoglobales archaeon]
MSVSDLLQKKILSKIKQKEPGAILGGMRTIFTRTQTYFSIINFLLILVTAYYTTIRHVFPWLPFFVFFVFLVILLMGLMVFEYTVMFPSDITFQWHQIWRPERNPMYGEIKHIQEELDEIKERLKRIEEKLGVE